MNPRPHATSNQRLHEPFLAGAQRANDNPTKCRALGAFLVLRLIDQWGDRRSASEAILYQLRATRAYVDGLPTGAVDAEHLRNIVTACAHVIVEDADFHAMLPPLLAFAFWLEKDLHLTEALDVLETLLEHSAGDPHRYCVSAIHQQARVLRLLGRLDDALVAYQRGEQMATAIGDTHSALVLRIGRAITLQKTGNLPKSERQLRGIVSEAKAAGDKVAEAMATHDLAIALHLAGRTDEAVPLAFSAYELREDRAGRLRALSDTGVLFKELGHLDAARQTLYAVLGADPSREIRARVVLELIEVSACAGDRLSFERWRREAEPLRATLPVDEVCNLELALGMGFASFGSLDEAIGHVERAVQFAEEAKLGERLYKAERALRELREHQVTDLAVPQPPPPSPELQNTIERINALAF